MYIRTVKCIWWASSIAISMAATIFIRPCKGINFNFHILWIFFCFFILPFLVTCYLTLKLHQMQFDVYFSYSITWRFVDQLIHFNSVLFFFVCVVIIFFITMHLDNESHFPAFLYLVLSLNLWTMWQKIKMTRKRKVIEVLLWFIFQYFFFLTKSKIDTV